MEKFMLASTLLVCDANLPTSCTFFWAGSLVSENEHVDVIAFRTNTTSNFKSMLKKDLDALKAMKQTDNVKAQITFIQNTLLKMSTPAFIHTPKQILLNTVAKGLKLPSLIADDVVYLSGVSSISK